MASFAASRGAGAAFGKTGSSTVGKLVGYFTVPVVGASIFAYANMDWGEKKIHSVQALREGRKQGISEFRRLGSYQGETTHMGGLEPEKAHHMRTGKLTLQRQDSRNPNVRHSIDRKLSRMNSKFERDQARRTSLLRQETEEIQCQEKLD